MKSRDATILIVDDEAVLAEIMARRFEREGYHTLTAENGLVALEKLAAHRVDVMVTDVRMPVMDGVALMKKVKSSGQYKPSVICVSGYNDIPPQQAHDLGVESTLAKPFEHEELLAAVERTLTDRKELLGRPWTGKTGAILEAQFESLSKAVRDGSIAFGRGGFCFESSVALKEGPVRLAVDFAAEKQRISGYGFVRWSADQQIGVELAYLDDECRDWVVRRTDENPTVSFIPATSRSS